MKTTKINSAKSSTNVGLDGMFNNDEYGFGTSNIAGKLPVDYGEGSGGGGCCCCCCCCCCCGSGAADIKEN